MTLWSRLRHRLGAAHLADDEILQLLMPPGADMPSPVAGNHLGRCDRCASRAAKLRAFLNGLTETNESALAGVFPVDRLATQRTRIMRRLRRSVEPARPARVLSFPALARPALSGTHRARYWLGAAAAAGLLVGITVGQFFPRHLEPTSGAQGISAQAMVSTSVSALQRPSTASFTDPALENDDPFLIELELMLSSPQVPGLTPLDEITPRIREVVVNVW